MSPVGLITLDLSLCFAPTCSPPAPLHLRHPDNPHRLNLLPSNNNKFLMKFMTRVKGNEARERERDAALLIDLVLVVVGGSFNEFHIHATLWFIPLRKVTFLLIDQKEGDFPDTLVRLSSNILIIFHPQTFPLNQAILCVVIFNEMPWVAAMNMGGGWKPFSYWTGFRAPFHPSKVTKEKRREGSYPCSTHLPSTYVMPKPPFLTTWNLINYIII